METWRLRETFGRRGEGGRRREKVAGMGWGHAFSSLLWGGMGGQWFGVLDRMVVGQAEKSLLQEKGRRKEDGGDR